MRDPRVPAIIAGVLLLTALALGIVGYFAPRPSTELRWLALVPQLVMAVTGVRLAIDVHNQIEGELMEEEGEE